MGVNLIDEFPFVRQCECAAYVDAVFDGIEDRFSGHKMSLSGRFT
jgi:hypothetical protein